jgi:hypothetical protein
MVLMLDYDELNRKAEATRIQSDITDSQVTTSS